MKPWLQGTLICLSVGGGFSGAALSLTLLRNAKLMPALIPIVFIFMYGFVAAAGVMFALDRRKTKPLLTAFALQIPYLGSPWLTYKFGAGLIAAGFIGGPSAADNIGVRVGGEWFFGAFWRFGLMENAPWVLGVNIVPLAILIILRRAALQNQELETVEATTSSGSETAVPEVVVNAPKND